MGRPVFKSGFAAEINAYIDYKVASGYKENSFYFILHDFDHFCIHREINTVTFTRADADSWSEKRETESSTSHYARVNKVKCFMEYLRLKGYDVYPLLESGEKGQILCTKKGHFWLTEKGQKRNILAY